MVDNLKKDPITGLLSEGSFLIAGEELVKKDHGLALIRIDIQHFSIFEEWFGLEKAQKLLKSIGDYLLNNKNCLVSGYFGRDDFSLIIRFDQRVIEEIYLDLKDITISLSSSYGFLPALGVYNVDKIRNLLLGLGRALIACDSAKRNINNRIGYYDQDLEVEFEKESEILKDFKEALDNNEITFYLQPQCRISTGQVVGAEALARWIKKDGKMISPATFIPILEKYGFVIDLDKYLWEKIAIYLKDWLDMGRTAVPISVNVSRTDIFAFDIADYFINLCNRHSLPHNLIKIEITESAYIERTEYISALVKRLRTAGFSVLMDDFGSGYSSLNMFSNIEVDAIKLDALFLKFDSKDNSKAVRVLESVVNMAKVISMPIIVEGVETKEQADFLEGLGCRYVQGFYFYRPMPLDDFRNVIRNEKNIDRKGFVAKANEQFRLREFLDQNVYSDNMLNNIIGSVAFYELHDDIVDIVRYNEQFYKAVNVPDFAERLDNIGRFVPEEDKPILLKALKKAIKNRLNGAEACVRFSTINGTLLSFLMHFYHIGTTNGRERFYGSAHNITELQDYKDSLSLVTKYSDDSIILVSRVDNKWKYKVASHGLSKIVGLSAQELEKEMNEGTFINHLVRHDDLKLLMQSVKDEVDNERDFIRYIEMYDKDNNPIKIELLFHNVKKLANNVSYVLKTSVVD